MKIVHSPAALIEAREAIRGSVGFVPTMGALHSGHASLLARSKKENDTTILSLFVNPTQFDRPDDLSNYPRTYEADLALATMQGVDIVFAPSHGIPSDSLYPDGYRYRVQETEQSRDLCGASRPGHFDGVLTVVLKLLMLARADRAYFGEKDFQQLTLVRDMAEAFFIPTQIVACPTVRDEDGVALSSRNLRLTAEGRIKAASFAKILRESKSAESAKDMLIAQGIEIDYVMPWQSRLLAAVRIDGVRLIDNV